MKGEWKTAKRGGGGSHPFMLSFEGGKPHMTSFDYNYNTYTVQTEAPA